MMKTKLKGSMMTMAKMMSRMEMMKINVDDVHRIERDARKNCSVLTTFFMLIIINITSSSSLQLININNVTTIQKRSPSKEDEEKMLLIISFFNLIIGYKRWKERNWD